MNSTSIETGGSTSSSTIRSSEEEGAAVSSSDHPYEINNYNTPTQARRSSIGEDGSHDGFVYPSPEDDSAAVKEQAKSFYKEHCIYLLPMLGWFFFSSCLSLYNKYVFGDCYMAFPCPLLMTSVHFGLQWLFSFCVTKAYPVPLGGDQIDNMSWQTFLWVAVPCGLVTSFDVGLSNLALVRITITFYTMVKSSAPIFVVASAYLFGIEQITWSLIFTVIIISAGEFLTVMGEVQFDLIGFFLVLSAAVLSGMRWTLVQLQLESLQPRLKSTFATMRILSPFMWGSMLFLSICLEEPWRQFGVTTADAMSATGAAATSASSMMPTDYNANYTDSTIQLQELDDTMKQCNGTEVHYDYFNNTTDTLWTLAIAVFGGFLAICMILCEFYLIMKTSAVVLMIGGVCKELTTIFLGITVFGDEMNPVNELGCAVVFSGVLLYKASHHRKKHEKVYDSVDADSHGSHDLQLTLTEADGYHGRGDGGAGAGAGAGGDIHFDYNQEYAGYDSGTSSTADAASGNGSRDVGKNGRSRRGARQKKKSQSQSIQPLVNNGESEII